MAILEQLGINQTLYIQFFVFLVGFLALSMVAFRPYANALEERENRTKGGAELAVEIQKQSVELQNKFETKARSVGGEIKTIFDSYRDEANKEYEGIVTTARSEAQKLIEEARARVSLEVVEATKKLKEEIPQLASAITQKLLAK